MLLVDSHLDLAWNACEWGRDVTREIGEIRKSEAGQSGPGRGRNTVSLPELHRAECGLFFGTLLARKVVDQNPPFIPFPDAESAEEAALQQLDYYRSLEVKGALTMIADRRALEKHLARWWDEKGAPLGYVLSMEGADPISDVDALSVWWQRGLRLLGPVHYGSNRWGSGTSQTGGLTEDGTALLREMERIGFILDITHFSDEAFFQAVELFGGPLLASHHNCRKLVPHQRQLSDRQIETVLARQGVIGVALDAWMLQPHWVRGQRDRALVTIEDVIDHIDHICQLAGHAEQVGIGSDLDGGFGTEQCPRDLETIADLQKLPELLANRGYSTEHIRGIMHGNWIRFLRENLPAG